MVDSKNDIPEGGNVSAAIASAFDEAYEELKKITAVGDSSLEEAVNEMESQDHRHVLTQEFLSDGLRQGTAYEFEELNWKDDKKAHFLSLCKDPKAAVVKYFQ